MTETGFDHKEEHRGSPHAEPEPEPAASPSVAHFTRAERVARGREARAETPRASQASFDTFPPRDPVELLELQAPSRVPELVPIRYGRMLVSPFAFFRGRAAIMAHDIASDSPDGSGGAALRRRAPRELRRLRLARARPRLRPERLRRDARGPVRMGPEAPRGELRGRGTRSRVLRRRAPRGRPQHGRLLPSGDAASSRR